MISVVAAAGTAINLPINRVLGFPSSDGARVYACQLHISAARCRVVNFYTLGHPTTAT